MVIVGSSVIFNTPIALLPVQILWLNLLTDGFLSIGLANEGQEHRYSKYHFSRYRGSILNKYDIFRIINMVLVMSVVSITMFLYMLKIAVIEVVRTCMLIIVSLFHWVNAINIRKNYDSIFSYNPFSNKFIFIGLIIEGVLLWASVYTDIGNRFLHTVKVNPNVFYYFFFVSLIILILDELYKFFYRIKKDRRGI
ncbi:MAG: P-type Ca2+ transporter type [Patescibacteria group bacterium]|nr:P-type Ca2+ transporter type [Patescibacteria group bacterium]